MAGFPDDEISGWAPVIEALKDDYFLISVCFPGNEKNGKPRPWGYNFDEVVDMLDRTIESIRPLKPFTLVTHDWGAVIGYLYENKYSHKVQRMVALDIGLNVLPRFRLFFYQLWLGVTYIISQFFGRYIAAIPFFVLFGLFIIFPFLGPLGKRGDAPKRPWSDLHAEMCYPYYYIWKHIFKQPLKDIITLNDNLLYWKMPKCPILFLYGRQKNVMFHGPKFLTDISEKFLQDSCSKSLELDAGHWLMHQQTQKLIEEMKSFFLANERKSKKISQ